jgi:hypothetical protein
MAAIAAPECLEFAPASWSKVRHPERIALAGRVTEKESERNRSFSARFSHSFADNPEHAGCPELPRDSRRSRFHGAARGA